MGRQMNHIGATLGKLWMRCMRRNIHYSSNYTRLNALYAVRDPWRMDSAQEKHRFLETNRIIRENFGHLDSILEIGCGEGHQSVHLAALCDRLTGLDVSARAVKRARSRCPGSDFIVGDVFSEEVALRAPFDLVIACEVLYYMKDVPDVIQRMREIASTCLVTYFGEQAALDRHILRLPGVSQESIEFGPVLWQVVRWPQRQVMRKP